MPKFQRVALFMDYENFHATLQKRTSTLRHQYGFSPHLDFRQLVDFIEAHYGPLARRDFIAVANFTHYDRQKGGLNQVATLIHVDSFEPRTVRRREQKTAGGRKHVISNYADMRLAYEVGCHVQRSPAGLYILASGDKAFVAVAQALREAGYPVYFLLADSYSAAAAIKDSFDWFEFDRTQTPPEVPAPPQAAPQPSAAPPPPADEVDALCATLGTLRRELNTGIPVALLKALLPVERAEALIQKAHSQGRIDLWTAPESGVQCVSLREERLFDKVTPIPVRPEVARRAAQLYALQHIPVYSLQEPTRAAWKRAIKARLNLSNRETKALLQALFQYGLLQPARLERLHLSLESALRWLRQPPDSP